MEAGAKLVKRYETDCQHLYWFISGNGAKSEPRKLVEILAYRSMEDLKLIRETYNALYNQDLLYILSQKSNLLSRVAYLIISQPPQRDAQIIRGALFGKSFDSSTLTEVICTRSSSELRSAKHSYQSRYNSNVERDVSSLTSGHLKQILMAILNSSNFSGNKVDMSMAMCDAKILYEAIESGKSVDHGSIISVLSRRNTDQIKSILSSFKQLYGHELMKFLKKDKCSEFGKQLRVAIRCIQQPEKQFAKQLRTAMVNGNAREVTIRTIITRSGVDIKQTNSAFAAKTGFSLESIVSNEFGSSSSTCDSDKAGGNVVVDVLMALLNK